MRTPAALCGVCGFEPSLGTLSTEGIPLSATMDHTGIITKTMEDMLSAFQTITGNKKPAKGSWQLHRPRIGIPNAHFAKDANELVSRRFWNAVDKLRELDEFDISEDVGFPPASRTRAVRTTIQLREAAWFYEEIVKTERLRRKMHADVLGFLDRGSKLGMLEYMHARRARSEFIGEMSAAFRDLDFCSCRPALSWLPSSRKFKERSGEA